MKRITLLAVYRKHGVIITEFGDTDQLLDGAAAAARALVGEAGVSADVQLAAGELARLITELQARRWPLQNRTERRTTK